MAYDEGLAERLRGLLEERRDVVEKRMFGGLAFMVSGHMTVGIVKDDLMVRVGPDDIEALVRRPHARRMDFTGRPLQGFLFVAPEGVDSDASLEEWLTLSLRYTSSLPPKADRPPALRKPRPSAAKKGPGKKASSR